MDNKNNEQTSDLNFPTGKLNHDEINAILNILPVDISFVDKDNNVKFFNKKDDYIFKRNKNALDKPVQRCHPKSLVPAVEKIIDDFRSGKESKISFITEKDNRFIYAEYYALKDDNNNYLGTLEVVEDLTDKRKLSKDNSIISDGMDES